MTTFYDLAEPIEAYRCWRIGGAVGNRAVTLGALSFGVSWEPEMTALPCLESGQLYSFQRGYGNKAAPACDGPPCGGDRYSNPGVVGHGCGIYALKSLIGALANIGHDCVAGKVLLGGKVWPHENGYRAEKAKIAGLYGPGAFSKYERYFEFRPFCPPVVLTPQAEALAESYEVPLLELTESEHVAVEWEAESQWVSSRLGIPV
jgi:hypothetical protein